MHLPKIPISAVKNKKIFLRLDLDVPLKGEKIEDEERLESGLETIHFLIKNGAEVLIAGHLGRPFGKDEKFSLRPVAKWFAKKIGYYQIRPEKFNLFHGWRITERISILENLRFYKGEEANNKTFAKELALLADTYINDAFAVSHRSHASIVGVAQILPHFGGLHLRREIEVLGEILGRPGRPLVMIIGGAKIETKLPLVEKMHRFADYVLIGGKIAQETRIILKIMHEKIEGRKSTLFVGDSNYDGTDLSEKSVENFLQVIGKAKTIVWNGPVGKTNLEFTVHSLGFEETEKGTRKIALAIARSKAFSVVGGGDTLGFLKKIELLNKFDFVSMGGGAMLSFLAGEKLPGIEVLKA